MRKLVVLPLLVVCAVTGVVLYGLKLSDVHRSPERRKWKDNATAAIKSDLKEPDYLKKRFGYVPGPRGDFDTSEPEWMTEDTVVCRDGSWLAYRSQCHKQDPKVHDIFVARASDGKWYYSDYHFCIGAFVLRSNGQPESLEQFKTDYYLTEFDGSSDAALNPTWDP